MNSYPAHLNKFKVHKKFRKHKTVLNNNYSDQYRNYALMLQLYAIRKKETATNRELRFESVVKARKTKTATASLVNFFSQVSSSLNQAVAGIMSRSLMLLKSKY